MEKKERETCGGSQGKNVLEPSFEVTPEFWRRRIAELRSEIDRRKRLTRNWRHDEPLKDLQAELMLARFHLKRAVM
jgi:hypothetical protein